MFEFLDVLSSEYLILGHKSTRTLKPAVLILIGDAHVRRGMFPKVSRPVD